MKRISLIILTTISGFLSAVGFVLAGYIYFTYFMLTTPAAQSGPGRYGAGYAMFLVYFFSGLALCIAIVLLIICIMSVRALRKNSKKISNIAFTQNARN